MPFFEDSIRNSEAASEYIPEFLNQFESLSGLNYSVEPIDPSIHFVENDYNIFWGVTEQGENKAFFTAEEEHEMQDEFAKAYSMIRGDPSQDDIQSFISWASIHTSLNRNLDNAATVEIQNPYNPSNLEMQIYLDEVDPMIYLATVSKGPQDIEEVQSRIAKEAGKDKFGDMLGKLLYESEERIAHPNYIDIDTNLEEAGFQHLGNREVPPEVNSDERYRGQQSELYQIPVSKTSIEGSTGFIKAWKLNEDTGMLVQPTSEIRLQDAIEEVENIVNSTH